MDEQTRTAIREVAALLDKARLRLEPLLREEMASEPSPSLPGVLPPLAWGAKVSPTFRDRVRWIAEQLDFDANWLMAAMAFETGRRFTANVKNPRSSATGLIQFMEATARGMGTTTAQLAAMTAEDQLNFVYKYFASYAGRLHSLWPKAIGQPDDTPIFVAGTAAYAVNAGLDANKDHQVTKAEAAAKVSALLAEGLQPQNAA
jgi:hypothetical protein